MSHRSYLKVHLGSSYGSSRVQSVLWWQRSWDSQWIVTFRPLSRSRRVNSVHLAHCVLFIQLRIEMQWCHRNLGQVFSSQLNHSRNFLTDMHAPRFFFSVILVKLIINTNHYCTPSHSCKLGCHWLEIHLRFSPKSVPAWTRGLSHLFCSQSRVENTSVPCE